MVERVTGIEPAFQAWEACVLPLNYTRVEVTLCLINGYPHFPRGERKGPPPNPGRFSLIRNLHPCVTAFEPLSERSHGSTMSLARHVASEFGVHARTLAREFRRAGTRIRPRHG